MKILISACMVGQKVRYDGEGKEIDGIEKLSKVNELHPICPEVLGGLPIPRNASEIKGNIDFILDGKIDENNGVFDIVGNDVTSNFLEGAGKVLEYCKKHQIEVAILKEKSPSCGSIHRYDGTHTRTLIDGQGLAAKLLMDNGIKVYNENNYMELLPCECEE